MLLGVGAVLLVSAGAAVASAYGGIVVRLLLLVLPPPRRGSPCGRRAAACAAPRRSSRRAPPGSPSPAPGGPALDGDPATALLLAGGFLVLHRSRRRPPRGRWSPGWPASWPSCRAAPGAGGLHTELYLCVALVGLGIALFGRRVVGRLALVTTGPWWLAGVVGGSSSAWADDPGASGCPQR